MPSKIISAHPDFLTQLCRGKRKGASSVTMVRDRMCRLRSKRGRLILWLAAGASLLLCSCGNTRKVTAVGASNADKALTVTIATVESREVRRMVEAVGSLFAHEEVSISPEGDGRAEKVLVGVGEQVTQSEALVQI